MEIKLALADEDIQGAHTDLINNLISELVQVRAINRALMRRVAELEGVKDHGGNGDSEPMDGSTSGAH